MQTAYSILRVKGYDDGQRIIRGVATTPEADRVGDIVVPTGVRYRNPLPLLWAHQHDKPVGTVNFERPTDKGINFEARLPKVSEPGVLKDRVDEAWHSIRAGLVAGVSIGFRAAQDGIERLKTGGIKYLKSEVLELSLVTVPANSSATITEIKALDKRSRTAAGPDGCAFVKIDRDLVLDATSLDARKTVRLRLTRIAAQHLAEALLEFSGASTKSHGRREFDFFPGHDLTDVSLEFRKEKPPAVPIPRGAVYLSRSSKR